LLDRVQKNETLTREQIKYLRKLGVVEGKAPRLYISATVAEMIDEQTQYIKNKGFNDDYYKDLILEYIKKFGKANKRQIRELLLNKLPDVLNESQKDNKIKNLLAALKKAGLIERDSKKQRGSNWIIAD
jgi:ATP-dependent DNA helicase RecG